MKIPERARETWLLLGQQLDQLAAAGRRTPCQVDPLPFTSSDPAERHEATHACQGCPALDLCLTYADLGNEPAHVWGGRDRTPRERPYAPRPNRRKAAA